MLYSYHGSAHGKRLYDGVGAVLMQELRKQ